MKEKESADVTRYVGKDVERELWARAAGRCQFSDCNKILFLSPVTKERVNIAEKAHIYSFSKKGPRGWGALVDKTNVNNISNLLLVCHDCHKTIDQDKNGDKYSASLLQQWKMDHENRVAIVTGIHPSKKSQVITYESNIAEQFPKISSDLAVQAMFPHRYPISEYPISLSMLCTHEDNSQEFWKTESQHLIREFRRRIEPEIISKRIEHFSVFGFAPMPLLILLGSLFTDKTPLDTYQLLKEPVGWNWQEYEDGFDFVIHEPEDRSKEPVLIISVSDRITQNRVTDVLGMDVSIWEITLPQQFLSNDNIRSKVHLELWRKKLRELMAIIRKEHHGVAYLHIFPCMSVSCSIELGRIRNPKVDPCWVIYDHNRNANNKFNKVLMIGEDDV